MNQNQQLLTVNTQQIIIVADMYSQDQVQRQSTSQEDTKGNMQPRIPIPASRSLIKYSVLILFFASVLSYARTARHDSKFRPYIDTSSFYSESDPKIYAGEIHYSRIPVEYWEHRIQMVKAMGLNALSIYIMWNYHEIQRGKFDFENGNRNLSKFLGLAEQYELKVLIRPGPYVCAEWDFGGLPARLLAVPGLEIRSNNDLFLEEVREYFTAVAPILRDHLWSPEDPQKCIIMLQIENEYGFFGADISYIMALKAMWNELYVKTAEYYVDWIINIRKSHWPGANIGLNDAFTQVEIDYIKLSLEQVGMVFGGEIYSGWLTHWHEPRMQRMDPIKKVEQYSYLMSHNISYAMYMAHGGSNFGLTAGANSAYREYLGFGGHVTSYDYDAPISEQGTATSKYHIFREQIMKYANWPVPDIPEPIPMVEISPLTPRVVAKLYENIDFQRPCYTSDSLHPFESPQLAMYRQGIVIYRTKLPPKSNLNYMIELHDLGYLRVNGKFITFLDRTVSEHHQLNLSCNIDSPCTMDLLVEAMGHDNYDLSMKTDFKGLLNFKTTVNEHKFHWQMFTLDITQQITQWEYSNSLPIINDSVLYKGQFSVEEVGDSYLNMTGFNKGYIWVNGHNLGSYWSVGPQYKIFCPGVWMKSGNQSNHIHILEMLYDGEQHQIVGELSLYD